MTQYFPPAGGGGGPVNWDDITNRPDSSAETIDDAVTKRHAHANKTSLDRLSVASGTGAPQVDGVAISDYLLNWYNLPITLDAQHAKTHTYPHMGWDFERTAPGAGDWLGGAWGQNADTQYGNFMLSGMSTSGGWAVGLKQTAGEVAAEADIRVLGIVCEDDGTAQVYAFDEAFNPIVRDYEVVGEFLVTLDRGTFSIYVNGELAATTLISGSWTPYITTTNTPGPRLFAVLFQPLSSTVANYWPYIVGKPVSSPAAIDAVVRDSTPWTRSLVGGNGLLQTFNGGYWHGLSGPELVPSMPVLLPDNEQGYVYYSPVAIGLQTTTAAAPPPSGVHTLGKYVTAAGALVEWHPFKSLPSVNNARDNRLQSFDQGNATGNVSVILSLARTTRLTVTGNTTLIPGVLNPTEAGDMEAVIALKQGGVGGHSVTLSTAPGHFRFGASITEYVPTATAGKTDYIGVVFNTVDGCFDVISVVKGY